MALGARSAIADHDSEGVRTVASTWQPFMPMHDRVSR